MKQNKTSSLSTVTKILLVTSIIGILLVLFGKSLLSYFFLDLEITSKNIESNIKKDPSYPFNGFWETDCKGNFGLAIEGAGDKDYFVRFCGPGGCFRKIDMFRVNLSNNERFDIMGPDVIGFRSTKNSATHSMIFIRCSGSDHNVVANKTKAEPLQTNTTMPDAPITDPRLTTLLNEMKDSGKASDLQALLASIESAKASSDRFPGSLVIVGKITVSDGKISPKAIYSQVPVEENGYFASEVRDLESPIGFRADGYAPLDFKIPPLPGEVTQKKIIYVGEMQLERLSTASAASIEGGINLGGLAAGDYKAGLHLQNGPINTPHNGTRGNWSSNDSSLKIAANGSFKKTGLLPAEYYFQIAAPGRIAFIKTIQFHPGEKLDLGEIKLEEAVSLEISYIVSQSQDFKNLPVTSEKILAGTKWKASKSIYGFDIEFKQINGNLDFDYSYGPATVADVGTGDLESVKNNNFSDRAMVDLKSIDYKKDHIYLYHGATWKHWVLFKLKVVD
ncbi:MAG TPA: hypothetical protein VNJ01_00450 [Bacteriovoracaceae bacterium]|nr:hypothetical protein [Bacteriovoracaceae bacterium]